MGHRWRSESGYDDGNWAECDWCGDTAIAQAKDGKVVIRYNCTDTPYDEPSCSGKPGTYYDHDINFIDHNGPGYPCTRCDYVLDMNAYLEEPSPPCIDKNYDNNTLP